MKNSPCHHRLRSLQPRSPAIEIRYRAIMSRRRMRRLLTISLAVTPVLVSYSGTLPLSAAESEPSITQNGASLAGLSSFVQTLIILLREGAEAMLIFSALWVVLKRLAAPARAFRTLGAGAILGVLASSIVAGTLLMFTSGVDDMAEMIEGISLLTAALLLLFVSSWLLGQREALHWKRHVEKRAHEAWERGSLFGLFAISFLAVFREGAETALFLQALTAAEGWKPTGLIAGGAAAASVLFVAFLLVRSFGMHLPVRRFFMITAWTLLALAVIYAGKGVHALQEYGLISETAPFALPRIAPLGIYPYLETLIAQGFVLLLGLALNAHALRKMAGGRKASAPVVAE